MASTEDWSAISSKRACEETLLDPASWVVEKEMSSDWVQVRSFHHYGLRYYELLVQEALDYMAHLFPEQAMPHWAHVNFYEVSKTGCFGMATSKTDIVRELTEAYKDHYKNS